MYSKPSLEQDQMEKLRRIRDLIAKFRAQPKQQLKPSPKLIEALKSQMDEIDSNITNLKAQTNSNLESLSHEEKLLTREMEVYDAKITNWLKNPNGGGAQTERPNATAGLNEHFSQSELLKEVIDFDVKNKELWVLGI